MTSHPALRARAHSSMSRHSCSVLAILLAVSAVLPTGSLRAQEGDDAIRAQQAKEEGADGSVTEEERAKAELAGKEAGGQAGIIGGLDRFMLPVTSIEPARIPPGGTGTLVITLALREGAVLAGAPDLELRYSPAQAPAQLGVWALGEPSVGTEEGAFRGKPVYENYAIVRIPLSVDAAAAHGKYQLSASIIAKLSDPRLGTTIGQFQGPAIGQLVVGPALPTPQKPAAGAAPSALGPRQPDKVTAKPADDGSVPVPVEGEREVVAAAAQGAGHAAGDPAVGWDPSGADGPLEERGDTLLLWIGGGAGLVLLLALVLGARRGRD
jgi:hypothetical protein